MKQGIAVRSAALVFTLGIAAGCDDGATVDVLVPKMEVTPNPLDFGNVQVATSVTKRIDIKNDGTGTLSISSVEPLAIDEEFTLSVPDPLRVQARGAGFIDVTFAPLQLGERGAVIRISSSDQGIDPIDVEIKGTGVTAELAVDPSAVAFGNVVLQTTKLVPVTVTNNSDFEADIELVPGANTKFQGRTEAAVFTVSPTTKPLSAGNRFKLAPGESTTLNAGFTPAVAGTRERGSFVLKACESCSQEVTLDGIGVESGFRCQPASLDFGAINPGSCRTRPVTCENIANESITVVGWGPGTNTSADFSFETFESPQFLREGDSVAVDVTYCPNDLGNDRGTLAIETDNQVPRLKFVNVDLLGSGGGPDIDVQPMILNFGEVSLIAPSRRTIQVANVGYENLEVSEVLADVAATGAFTANPAGFSVPTGGFHDLTVEFQPTVEGPISTELIIRSNDQDEPEVRVVLQGVGVNLPPCNFEVVPPQLGFGVVQLGSALFRAFEIRNLAPAGTGSDCLLTSARMNPGSGTEFSLPDGDLHSVRIPAGSSQTISVRYVPESQAAHTGEVEFSISSPTSPFNLVSLTGTGANATLLIVPRDVDFGVVGIGCSARNRIIQIYNTGATPAQITNIQMATPPSPAFRVANLPSLPTTLAPGASTQFEVGFTAAAEAAYAGAVEISATFNGQPVTYVVSLEGRGAVDAVSRDRFEQLPEAKVDILFVIDDSCSMYEEQTSLSANFDAFIRFADAQNIDYQLGVTTTDVDSSGPQGRLVPLTGNAQDRIVTPYTQPAPETVFGRNVNVGTNGSAFEQGLEAAYKALSSPNVFGHNNGLLRADAVLSIIFVSDEQDQSPNNVDFYINFFLSIKGFRNTNLFTASAIVGDSPGGCNGSGGNADDGIRYIQVAQRTGGVFQSICSSDWSRSLEDLSTSAFGFKSRFFLQNQPVVSTLRVVVDGQEIPATSNLGTVNWTYDYATNSINFTTFSTPEPGAEIDVEYAVECL